MRSLLYLVHKRRGVWLYHLFMSLPLWRSNSPCPPQPCAFLSRGKGGLAGSFDPCSFVQYYVLNEPGGDRHGKVALSVWAAIERGMAIYPNKSLVAQQIGIQAFSYFIPHILTTITGLNKSMDIKHEMPLRTSQGTALPATNMAMCESHQNEQPFHQLVVQDALVIGRMFHDLSVPPLLPATCRLHGYMATKQTSILPFRLFWSSRLFSCKCFGVEKCGPQGMSGTERCLGWSRPFGEFQ
ncbi:hypothetical protein LZ31DRAFT_30297 [Colletotrichum somersetense]|nr:hypothetical protein LZ31DRAFT_30297 [Colletotrichum somersetense]